MAGMLRTKLRGDVEAVLNISHGSRMRPIALVAAALAPDARSSRVSAQQTAAIHSGPQAQCYNSSRYRGRDLLAAVSVPARQFIFRSKPMRPAPSLANLHARIVRLHGHE